MNCFPQRAITLGHRSTQKESEVDKDQAKPKSGFKGYINAVVPNVQGLSEHCKGIVACQAHPALVKIGLVLVRLFHFNSLLVRLHSVRLYIWLVRGTSAYLYILSVVRLRFRVRLS